MSLPNNYPSIETTVAIAEAEVLADIATGRVPATVASFSELHDHVDANEYGGATEPWAWWEGCTNDDEFCAYWNEVQRRVDGWLRAGGHRAAGS